MFFLTYIDANFSHQKIQLHIMHFHKNLNPKLFLPFCQVKYPEIKRWSQRDLQEGDDCLVDLLYIFSPCREAGRGCSEPVPL